MNFKIITKKLKKNKVILSFSKNNSAYLYLRVYASYIYNMILVNSSKINILIRDNHYSVTTQSILDLGKEYPTISQIRHNNKYIQIIDKQKVRATKNVIGKSSRDVLYLYSNKKLIDKVFVTIVNWKTNKSMMKLIGVMPKYNILAQVEEVIYFAIGRYLYKTCDNFVTKTYISTFPHLPAIHTKMLFTPSGYFIVANKKIFYSKHLYEWSECCEIQNHGLMHMFDFFYDKNTKSTYVYAGEYSVERNKAHKVYRGIINYEGQQEWDVILDFSSINDYISNQSDWFSCRHVHVVTVDRYTGALWVATGDSDIHSKIIYSMDNGTSFQILGIGSQQWRTLSIWFTSEYIYWNMDTHEPQKIFRVNKKLLKLRKTITPEINNTTQMGVKYLVIESEQNVFPCNVGSVYTESIKRKLNSKNKVIALNDPSYDFREEVADLSNGAQWYHCWAKDNYGEDIVIMGTSPEGSIRDMQGRVFGIKELSNKSVEVQELLTVSPKNQNLSYDENMFTQLEPLLQDSTGVIYLRTRNVFWDGILKALIQWDN